MLSFSLSPGPSRPAPSTADLYDLLILGGGPAGLTAGLYAARNGLATVLLERGLPGGQMASTESVENCPGCVEGPGAAIGQRMLEQGQRFGPLVAPVEVQAVELRGDEKLASTAEGTYRARAALLAPGAQSRRLDVPGEERFFGRGVATCPTCDGPFYRGDVRTGALRQIVTAAADSAIAAMTATHDLAQRPAAAPAGAR